MKMKLKVISLFAYHHVREFDNDGVLFMASNYIKPLIVSYLNNQPAD